MKASITVLLALPLLPQQAVDSYSVEKERALGRELAAEIIRRSKPLDNAIADAYVKRIGSQLVSHLAETPFEYNFEVILATGGVEPQSIPGGYIFIPASFFVAAQDEAEFAGMLAHAIGHIALRHGTRRTVQVQLQNGPSIPLIFIGGWTGSHADPQRPILTPAGFVPFQREYELEADAFGFQLAARSGFDPAGLRRYIARTQPADSRMSPLPARELRLANLDDRLNAIAVTTPTVSDEFRRAREAVRDSLQQLEEHRAPTLRR